MRSDLAASSPSTTPSAEITPANIISATTSMMPEPQMPVIVIFFVSSAKPGSLDHRSEPMILNRGSSVSGSMRTRSMAPTVARWPDEICAPSNAGPVGLEAASMRSLLPSTISAFVPTSTISWMPSDWSGRSERIAPAVSAPTWPAMQGSTYTRVMSRQLMLRNGARGDPAHQVFTELDLRVHSAGAGQSLTGAEIEEVAGDGGRTDIDGDAEHPIVELGPRGDDLGVVPHGNRDLATLREDRLDLPHDGEGSDELFESPVVSEGVPQHVELTAGRVEVLGADGGVVQANDGVDLDVLDVEPLAHDLPMHLALGRDVDDDVVENLGVATQPVRLGPQRPASPVLGGLARSGRAHTRLARGDAVLGELADLGDHLATAADAAATADRVQVHAELAGGVEHVRAALDLALAPRRGEDDACRVGHRRPIRIRRGPDGHRDDGRHPRHHQRRGRAWRRSTRHSSRRGR